jgi:predicted transcriptional regulator
MKTAVSIPDPIFARLERLARRTGRSRSEIVSTALEEYAARHTPDEITEALNAACGGEEPDPFATAAAERLLRSVEW